MSDYRAAAYHPTEKRIRGAMWLDDYFGRYAYGVQFDPGGPVFRSDQVQIPLGVVFVPETPEET